MKKLLAIISSLLMLGAVASAVVLPNFEYVDGYSTSTRTGTKVICGDIVGYKDQKSTNTTPMYSIVKGSPTFAGMVTAPLFNGTALNARTLGGKTSSYWQLLFDDMNAKYANVASTVAKQGITLSTATARIDLLGAYINILNNQFSVLNSSVNKYGIALSTQGSMIDNINLQYASMLVSMGTHWIAISTQGVAIAQLQSDLATEVSDRQLGDYYLGRSTAIIDNAKLDKSSATVSYLHSGLSMYYLWVSSSLYASNATLFNGHAESYFLSISSAMTNFQRKLIDNALYHISVDSAGYASVSGTIAEGFWNLYHSTFTLYALNVSSLNSNSVQADSVTVRSYLGLKVAPEIIRPNGDYYAYMARHPNNGQPHYLTLIDGNDSTWLVTNNVLVHTDLFELSDLKVSSSAVISDITVWARVSSQESGGEFSYSIFVDSSSNRYEDSMVYCPYGISWVSKKYSLNPLTGTAWTRSAIDNLKLGVNTNSYSGYLVELYCTVSYQDISITGRIDGLQNDLITERNSRIVGDSGLQGSIDAQGVAIADLQGSSATLESNVNSLSIDVAGLKESSSTLESRANTFSAWQGSASPKIDRIGISSLGFSFGVWGATTTVGSIPQCVGDSLDFATEISTWEFRSVAGRVTGNFEIWDKNYDNWSVYVGTKVFTSDITISSTSWTGANFNSVSVPVNSLLIFRASSWDGAVYAIIGKGWRFRND